jgi:hypothetical protein
LGEIEMKKIGYVLLGLCVSILLTMILYYLIPRLLGILPGRYYLLIAFFIILPVGLATGSLLSGYLVQHHMERRSFFRYLLVSPGSYLSVTMLIIMLLKIPEVKSRLTMPPDVSTLKIYLSIAAAVAVILLLLIEWIMASFVGTRLGIFLRDRSTRQPDNQTTVQP